MNMRERKPEAIRRELEAKSRAAAGKWRRRLALTLSVCALVQPGLLNNVTRVCHVSLTARTRAWKASLQQVQMAGRQASLGPRMAQPPTHPRPRRVLNLPQRLWDTRHR